MSSAGSVVAVRGVSLRRELAAAAAIAGTPALVRLRERAVAMILEEDLIDACYTCGTVEIDAVRGEFLHAGGRVLRAPRLLPEQGRLEALGCGVCTLGPRLEQAVGALFAQRRAALAVVLDEIGTEMLFALGRRIQDRMLSSCFRTRRSMGVELHAGDPGLGLEAHEAVLHLAQADKIGVGLHRGQLLTPLKSSSVVFAVGRDLPQVAWSRCASCPSAGKCNFGRAPRADQPVSLAA